MTGCFRVSLFFISFSALVASAHSQSLPAPTASHEVGLSARADLPIKIYRDYLVIVEGSIGIQEKLTFIIDTGAYPSVINERIATALGLSVREGRVALVNQSVKTRFAILPILAVGPARAENVTVVVQNLSSVEKTLGRRVDAIVGLDVLAKNSFTIDYRTNRLRFGPVDPTRFKVPFETGPPSVTVKVRLFDSPVLLLVDTGASELMLFQSRLKNSISRLAQRETEATNISGDFQRKRFLVPDMRLGKEELGPQIGYVGLDHIEQTIDFDGVLSMRGMHLETISFDFSKNEVSWKK